MAIGSLVPGSRIMTITALFFYLAIALFASSAAADDIHGCGGFVEVRL